VADHGGTGGVRSAQHAPTVLTAPATGDCGPGCRIALGAPIQHGSGWGHGYGPDAVADTGRGLLLYSTVGSVQTLVLRRAIPGEPPRDSPVFAAFHGSRLAYSSLTWPTGTITVYDPATKLHSSYFDYDQPGLNVFELWLTDDYVFWLHPSGIGRADLKTGGVSEFSNRMSCSRACVMDGKIICADNGTTRIERVDPETLSRTLVDDGGAMQIESGCSPDGERVVWVDFRDPPGPESTLSGRRVGGEIYMHEAATGDIRRLTNDLPQRSIPKTRPAVGTDLAVWREAREDCGEDFEFSQDFYACASVLVKYELETGRRCRRTDVAYGGWMSVHGHSLYAYWSDTNERYLVEVDLDDDGIPWICEDGR
jgi:hypothetical protein